MDLDNPSDVISFEAEPFWDTQIFDAAEQIFAMPTDLAPFDTAWIRELLDSVEQPDAIESSVDPSSTELVPYSSPCHPALPATSANESWRLDSDSNTLEVVNKKRYNEFERIL